MGRVDIVGFGSGSKEKMTFEAYGAISESDVIIGFTTYIRLIEGMFPNKEMRSTGMGAEKERCLMALEEARIGKKVSLVCSGDSSLYGMAALVYELNDDPSLEIRTIAGVTAALSGGALLGAALTNDFATVSLSDYMTSPEEIAKRLLNLAEADMLIVLYNPASRKRPAALRDAADILLKKLPEDRVCGVAVNIGRNDETSKLMTLKELRDYPADMFSTVFIGNSKSRVKDGKFITPRGYRLG